MNGNDLVAEFILDTVWDALPSDVQHKTRQAFLDVLGATIGGTATHVSDITAGYAAKNWRGEEATILLKKARSQAAGAAFANGYAANALDVDDCALFTRGHPGAQIFPTALAVTEKMGASGKDMLAAIVVGYEVAHRVARCWHEHHEIYQACGSWGSVACAAVAAKLMKLDKEVIKHALGIAEYHAPNLPMVRDIDDPAMVKHGIGWGAMTGVISAELAQAGFTGIPSILGFGKYHDWVATIGREYIMLDGVIFKHYASCGWGHAVFAAARKVMREHNIQANEIAHVRAEGYHETIRLAVRYPKTIEEAQFSLAWPLAALLLEGEVGPAQMLPHRFDDAEMRAMVDKIEIVESKEINDMYLMTLEGHPNGKYAGAVEITLTDRQSYYYYSGIVEEESRYGKQWSDEEIEDKFGRITSFVLPEEQVEDLLTLAWNFETHAHVKELTRFLA